MQSSPHSPQNLTPQQAAEQRLEAERMQEVMFLLKNLLDREQTTVKAIVACLLDIGAIHFINDRVRFRSLRPLARPLAKLSKPALIFFANRWVQQKCPQMIASFLGRRVLLKVKRSQPIQISQPVTPAVLEPTVIYQHEIRRLRSRVQLTTGALVGVSGVLVLALIGVDVKSVNSFWQSSSSSSNPSSAAMIQNHRPKPP